MGESLDKRIAWVLDHAERCRNNCGKSPEQCIEDDEVLTQAADLPPLDPWRSMPRGFECGLSMLRGRLDAAAALAYRVGRIAGEDEIAAADVRHATARQLRNAGFLVVHTPSAGKGKLGTLHTSVVVSTTDDLSGLTLEWPPNCAEAFARCFND